MNKKAKVPNLTLNAISDAVLNGQSIDISLYTEGYLNEDHLWKPPATVFSNPWENANKPHILMRPAQFFNKESAIERNVNKMSNGIVDFAFSDTITNSTKEPNVTLKKDVYVEELKLPEILIGSQTASGKSRKNLISHTHPTFETSHLVNQKLPRLVTRISLKGELPRSDLEIALNMIHDPLGGTTKKEKFKNLKKFEENVIQKSDLTNSNVLFDTKKAKNLENQLEKNLEKLNFNTNGANFHRLQVYSNTFEEIILDKNIFDNILSQIKKEYDDYLYYLLDKNSTANSNGEYLSEQAEITKSMTLRRTGEIRNITKSNEEIELDIKYMQKTANELKAKLEDEIKIYSDRMELENKKFMQESFLSITSNVTKVAGSEIENRITALKESILKKMKKIRELNETTNHDFVPNIVIANLTQNIKDTEVEIQKLIKQSEFLVKNIDESEEELRSILMKNDTTEFAEENVNFLIKTLKNLDVLQLSPIENDTKQIENDNKTLKTTTVPAPTPVNDDDNFDRLKIQTQSQNFYDDYFS